MVCVTDVHPAWDGLSLSSTTGISEISASWWTTRRIRSSRLPPLFDHGNALFNFAGWDALASEQGLNAYADTLMPCVYDNFFETAKRVMTDEHRTALRHLLTFRFKRHSRYNLPPERLKLIEKMVQSRARKLLE